MSRRLAGARSRYYRIQTIHGAVVTLLAGLGLFTGLSIIEAFAEGSSMVRSLFVAAGIAAVAVVGFVEIVVPLLRWGRIVRSMTPRDFAPQVGEKFPEIRDRLRNILEIFDEQTGVGSKAGDFHPDYSPKLIDASFADLESAAKSKDFGEVVSTAKLQRDVRLLAGGVLVCAVVFVVPQFGLSSAAYRLAHFQREFIPPSPFEFLVHPGDAEIVKGESLPVSISLLSNKGGDSPILRPLPKKITISVRQADMAEAERNEVSADSDGQFRYTIGSLRATSEYFAEAENVRSRIYTVTITERPVVRSLTLRVIPPSYSRLPEQTLDDNVGDLTALPGTKLRWRISVSKGLRHASLLFKSGEEVPLTGGSPAYAAEYTLRHAGSYHVALEDSDGVHNVDPIEYTLGLSEDENPRVEIIDPGRNIDVTASAPLPLMLKIHDDYGFTKLTLQYRLVHSRYEQPQERFTSLPIPLDPSLRHSTDGEVSFQWDVTSMQLVPEDVVEYHAEVFDNDDVSGPKKGVSESYLLRLPSLDEVFADAEKGESETTEKMDQSLQEAKDLKKNLDELSQDMKKNQQLDWQKQKKVEETMKRYQELTKKVDDISKSVDAMTHEMEKNNILSGETMEKYNELQRLLQQIDSPEFRDALKKMQEAMQNVSPDQLRQAMQQVQFSEEAFRQSIERTVELLKRIQVEQKMDEMVKRAKELRQQEDNLQKETAAADSGDSQKAAELSRKQEDIDKQLAELQKQLADLRTKMEEFASDMPMKQLEKAEAAATDSSMEESIQESSQQLRAQRPSKAGASQRQASAKMEQMEKRFSEMQEQLLSNQANDAMNGMRKATTDLLELSQREEELKDLSGSIDPNSLQFREDAEKQLTLRADLSNITSNLIDLGQKSFMVTPELGKAIGKAASSMSQSMVALEQRNGMVAGAQQKEAMASLNKAAMIGQASMDAMQQGSQGGGGSLLQQLRRLAGEQQSINVGTEKLAQGEGLSQEQMQEMGRLARQQSAVQKTLEELNKEAQGGSDRDRVMGDLKKIADDMKEVVENLEQNNVNPNTIKQQQRILSRLLEAQTSMRERDYEQKRTSTAGFTPVRRSPAELEAGSAQNQLRLDLLRAIEDGYSKDYQDLIRKYYDALDKLKQ